MNVTVFQHIDLAILHWFNDSHTLFLDTLALMLTNGLTWIPLYLTLMLLIIKNHENMPQVMLVMGGAIIAVILAAATDNLIVKPLVARPRPAADPILKYTINVVGNLRGNDYSFFSAHAANTMAIASFFCWQIRCRALSLSLIAWSLVNCWTRMYLGLHYPSDIIVGLLWGICCGSAAYALTRHLYYKNTERIHYVSTQYSTTGYNKTDTALAMTVLSVTLCYCVISAIANAAKF